MLAGLLAAGPGDAKTVVLSAAAAGGASLLTDIESPDSKLGRIIPLIPRLLKMTIGHRGPLHSLLAGAAVSGLFFAFFQRPDLACAVFFGYMSHVILDIFNSEGVPLLWPLKIRLGIPLTEPGGVIERLVILPALTVGLAVALCGILKMAKIFYEILPGIPLIEIRG